MDTQAGGHNRKYLRKKRGKFIVIEIFDGSGKEPGCGKNRF